MRQDDVEQNAAGEIKPIKRASKRGAIMSALFSAAMIAIALMVYDVIFDWGRFGYGLRWAVIAAAGICTFIVAYNEDMYGEAVLWGKRKEPRTPPRGFEVLPAKEREKGAGEGEKV